MSLLVRVVGEAAYRLGVGPMPSDAPDARLVELVEGPSSLAPGRALDLGCGPGRNALYLARHGWDVTGVDMVGRALVLACRRAAAAGLSLRLVHGDVTRLQELPVGDGYTLIMDGGCYHSVPRARRDAHASGVTRVAMPGAILVVVGFPHHGFIGRGVTAEDLRNRLPGWELVAAAPVPGEEMRTYISGPALVRRALARGWLRAWRHELTRRGAVLPSSPP